MAARRSRFPLSRREIEALPGVGQYIANAILCFCHRKPQPLLDVNMARVVERYFGPRKKADIRYDPYLQELTTHIVRPDCNRINWAILDFGALVCKSRKPLCSICPLFDNCCFAAKQLSGTRTRNITNIRTR
jgi:A/G-specific adenine glycosylase